MLRGGGGLQKPNALGRGGSFHCATVHKKRLQIFQNKVLKVILGKPMRTPTADVHKVAKVEFISEFLDRLSQGFDGSCRVNVNQDVRSMIDEFPIVYFKFSCKFW